MHPSVLVDPMHYPANKIQAAPSDSTFWTIWYGTLCQRLIGQRTTKPTKVRQQTPPWSHPDSVARGSVRHLGRHSYRHCGPLLPRHFFCLRSLGSWSGDQTQGKKYTKIACNYHFYPIAFETFSPMYQDGTDFIFALGHRISSNTDDPRENCFIFQRISIAIQRFNTVCFANSFGNTASFGVIDLVIQCNSTGRNWQNVQNL